MVESVITFSAIFYVGWQAFLRHQHRTRELVRFHRPNTQLETLQVNKKLDKFLEQLGRRFGLLMGTSMTQTQKDREMGAKLRSAGLESMSDQGRYILIRMSSYICWPIVASVAWMHFTPYYATVTSIFTFAFVVLAPHLWLSRKALQRKEEIQRELPLVIDLTNLATSAGWDTSVALEKVIDSLVPEFPNHPLLRELKRARWLVQSGYTWGEALDRVGKKIGDETVTRVTSALEQAMDKGGDRSAQLGGIAADAQRGYYAALDKRLAAIPVKALVITIVLFLTYFTVLLAPSMVGVISSMGSSENVTQGSESE